MLELIGQTLGQYKIVEKIGQGGMSTVFKARQRGLERWVAVKVLPPHYATDPDFSRYFLHEAQAIAHLEHPHILPVYDFGQQGEYTYLVMRYIANSRSLADVMKRSIPIEQALNYLKQIASALDYAHQRHIVHRDVKPANILLQDEWSFLADFGLARVMQANAQLITTGITIGTPAYMSPEQGRGDKVDMMTDIYAVGAIVYAMLAGQIPHMAETGQAIIYKRIHEPAPTLRAVRSDIPAVVDRVVQKALAPNPASRYQRAGDFVVALARALETSGARNLKTRPIQEISYIPSADQAMPIPAPQIPCPRCGAIMSVESISCPNCGLPLSAPDPTNIAKTGSAKSWRLAVLVSFLGLMILLLSVGIWGAASFFSRSGSGVSPPATAAGPRPTRNFTQALFFDDFDGVGLNRALWSSSLGGGQIQVFNSVLRLTSAGQSFPVVQTTKNPFPAEGDFRLYLSMRYLNVEQRATGVVLGTLPEAYQTNQDEALLPEGQIIGLWQDATSWRVLVTPDKIEAHILPNPKLDNFEIQIDYVNSSYTIRTDGKVIYVSNPTPTRPTVLWLGNPTRTESGGSWSGLEIEYVAIERLAGSIATVPTLSPTPPPSATPSPSLTPSPTPTPLGQSCNRAADPIYAHIWQKYRSVLGCPVSDLQTIPTIAEELFQGGHLFWRSDTTEVYIILDRLPDNTELFEGNWQRADPGWRWDGSNPDGIGLSPPAGLVEPKRGFGWLWRTHLGGPDSALGWALDKEYGFDNLGQVQNFEQGMIFKGSALKIYVLLNTGAFYAQ